MAVAAAQLPDPVATMGISNLPVNGQRILLLGMAYKRNTGDARESPSRTVALQLQRLGAVVCAVDSHVDDSQITLLGGNGTAYIYDALADSYTNARFDYTLSYPTGLFAPQPEAENGDGVSAHDYSVAFSLGSWI